MARVDYAKEVVRLRSALAIALHTARTDALTGLPNRAAFMRHRADLVDVPHSVLFVDVNAFKQVNDTFGHRAGDRVLQAIAERMLRATDDGRTVVARVAGDEFAATVLGDPAIGRDVAARITQAVHGPVPATDGRQVWPSVSVGVAWHRPGDDPASTLEAADKAMYATKARRVPAGLVPVDLPTTPLTTTGRTR